MKDRIFFDTNILCYAFDSSEHSKRDTCKRLIEKVYIGEIRGVVSNQVLVETYNVLERKFKISKEEVREIMKSLTTSEHWQRINYTSNTIDHALDDSSRNGVAFLDALIAQTMKENFISKIITEDENGFKKIAGIKVIDPFH